MAFENLGEVWTPASLAEYLKGRKKPDWVTSITMNHTAEPSLSQRPTGFTIQHIIYIADFYRRPKSKGGNGWTSAPHIFIDEDQTFGIGGFSSNLTSKNGMLFNKGDLIHGRFYVRKNQAPQPDETSWAPTGELIELAKN
jgi:hypothetical protein